METDHASRGRRMLEEIRLKRASERLHKTPSGSDLESSDAYGPRRYDGGNRAVEVQTDSYSSSSRAKELEIKVAELERENQRLLSKLNEKEIQTDSLSKRLNDLEENILPSLRKSMKDTSIEKDAAIVAREDALAHLRTMKKRLKEAEEEQYRAEEDAAALRAELNLLQRQGLGSSFSNIPLGNSPVYTVESEKEIMDLKMEIQHVSLLLQQEQQKLSEEQLRNSSLMAEKQEMEERLAALTKKSSEDALNSATTKTITSQDKAKLEKQLHDMALMVERLESSRQKLLIEIDSQSSEIERLFEENSNLTSTYEEAKQVALQWENQVKDCLKKNEELRHLVDNLRSEQVTSSTSDSTMHSNIYTEKGSLPDTSEFSSEILILKDKLAKEQSRADALAAETMKLTAELRRAVQAYNNLIRQYRPVLRDIENKLMEMTHESYAGSTL